MLGTARIALAAAGLLLAAACTSKSQDPVLARTAVRTALSTVLQAAARKDPKAAENRLGVTEFLSVHSQGKPKQLKDMTPQERAEAFNACFNQLVSVTEMTLLRDAASIDAALAKGAVEAHMKMKRAEAHFSGPPADGKGRQIPFKATLALYYDGNWRVVSCDPDLGR